MPSQTNCIVELFVMSRCPDAVDAEHIFSNVKEDVSDNVQIKLEFITNEDGSCKHGKLECNGNKLELAVQAVMGKTYNIFRFTNLLNKNFEQIGHVPSDLLRKQFSAAGLSDAQQAEILQLYHDKGDIMLQESGAYTRRLGIRFSCTVRIDGEVVGIRDSGTWKDMKHGIDGSPTSWVRFINSKMNA